MSDYYIGSFVVRTVVSLVGIVSTIFIVKAYKNGETKGTMCAKASSILCKLFGAGAFIAGLVLLFGAGACIAGLVLIIRFGIQN